MTTSLEDVQAIFDLLHQSGYTPAELVEVGRVQFDDLTSKRERLAEQLGIELDPIPESMDKGYSPEPITMHEALVTMHEFLIGDRTPTSEEQWEIIHYLCPDNDKARMPKRLRCNSDHDLYCNIAWSWAMKDQRWTHRCQSCNETSNRVSGADVNMLEERIPKIGLVYRRRRITTATSLGQTVRKLGL